MEKTSLRTLKERFSVATTEKTNSYAKLIKRKRLEKKRTLEELSKGICSPSYLSKIENANVEVDEYYYQVLFEKLDIPYEKVKHERDMNIFQTMLKMYLMNRFDAIHSTVTRAVAINTYCDTELELMLLFDNIIRGSFDECKLLINKLETLRNSLTNREILFFVYLTTLYYFRSNQTVLAFQNIIVLLDIKTEDDIVKYAIMDLATDIFYWIGAFSLFQQYLRNLYLLPEQLLAKRILIHRLQELSIISIFRFQKDLNEFELIKSSLDWKHDYIKEEYYYYLTYCYYQNQDYQKVLELGMSDVRSARLNALVACALERIDDVKLAIEYLQDLMKYQYREHESVYQNHVRYANQKFEQYGYNRLMGYMKNVVLENHKNNYNFFLYQIEFNEFIRLGFEMGRYKDTLRTVINQSHAPNLLSVFKRV